jgi:hypothetical protein
MYRRLFVILLLAGLVCGQAKLGGDLGGIKPISIEPVKIEPYSKVAMTFKNEKPELDIVKTIQDYKPDNFFTLLENPPFSL